MESCRSYSKPLDPFVLMRTRHRCFFAEQHPSNSDLLEFRKSDSQEIKENELSSKMLKLKTQLL
jgi:hypothetical protein